MNLLTLPDGVFAPYRIPLHDIRLLLTGSPPRLATSMPTGLPGAPGGKKSGNSTRRLLRSMPVRLWPEVRALPLGAERRVALSGASEIRSATRRLKLRRFGKLATASILRLHEFF
jgi:hypothetical protein